MIINLYSFLSPYSSFFYILYLEMKYNDNKNNTKIKIKTHIFFFFFISFHEKRKIAKKNFFFFGLENLVIFFCLGFSHSITLELDKRIDSSSSMRVKEEGRLFFFFEEFENIQQFIFLIAK
jgi:hypothetical protein